MYGETDVQKCLSRLGIERGDCIFLHASLKSLGPFSTTSGRDVFASLLTALQYAVGGSGTIVVPTFNFGFCEGLPFDVQNTKGENMGQFSEYVRTRPESLRSKHPFQSVAAVGAHAKSIAEANSRTAFSPGSSFSELLCLKCKIVFFGVPFVETFVHISEERAQVDYRFWKTFRGEIIDAGVSEIKDVDFYARKLDLVPEPRIDNKKLFDDFLSNGILKQFPLGDGYVGVADANDLVNNLTARFEANSRFALS